METNDHWSVVFDQWLLISGHLVQMATDFRFTRVNCGIIANRLHIRANLNLFNGKLIADRLCLGAILFSSWWTFWNPLKTVVSSLRPGPYLWNDNFKDHQYFSIILVRTWTPTTVFHSEPKRVMAMLESKDSQNNKYWLSSFKSYLASYFPSKEKRGLAQDIFHQTVWFYFIKSLDPTFLYILFQMLSTHGFISDKLTK